MHMENYKNNKSAILFCFCISLFVFLIYAHTLNYPWKLFDEQIIYNETVIPVPRSFSEIFEYIKYLGILSHFEASNPFYSSISNIRCLPMDNLINLFIFYLFQKNPFNYHLFSLILHLLNTSILFFLLRLISRNYLTKEKKKSLFLISILTLLWSLHPTNVEAVLFTTNWTVLLTSFLCFAFMFCFLNVAPKNKSITALITIIIFFIMAQSTREYPFVMPVILFFYLFANYRFSNNASLLQSLKHSLKNTFLFFAISAIFILFIFSCSIKTNAPAWDRIFWFSPQVFFHYLKLMIFPIHLSIDQTAKVIFSSSLLNSYSIFCTIFMYFLIVLITISIFLVQKRFFYFLFIGIFPFFIALVPFLHLISPTYCIASERYLYFPLFMLTFGVSHFIFYTCKNDKIKNITIILLTILLCFFSIQSFKRTLDWKDTVSLFTSALNEAPNDLFKGLRKQILGTFVTSQYSDKNTKLIGGNYVNDSINILEHYLITLENKKANDKSPDIIKFYGLDPLSMQAKTAYLLAYTKLSLNNNPEEAYSTLSPFMKDLKIIDTQILDFYLGVLFATNRLEEAEKLLTYAVSKKLSPVTLYIISELNFKYNKLDNAEQYLKKSFKYFPYNPLTLLGLKKLYYLSGNIEKYAYYSYLYGLRTHTQTSGKL